MSGWQWSTELVELRAELGGSDGMLESWRWQRLKGLLWGVKSAAACGVWVQRCFWFCSARADREGEVKSEGGRAQFGLAAVLTDGGRAERRGCRCVITGNGGSSYSYLGRPWGPFGRVVFAYTFMDQCIKHVGWNNWEKAENEKSACFYEYRCYGPGCCESKRVTWARELLDEEAEQFLMHGFIDPGPDRPWLAQRMALRIPYSA
ncbi:hypothetical protein REPUB_Repub09cG0048600 [Reevesia pubescens]